MECFTKLRTAVLSWALLFVAHTALAGTPNTHAGTTSPAATTPPQGTDSLSGADPYPSTYHPAKYERVAIVNATVLTAAGPRIQGGSAVVADGKILAVGTQVSIPPGARVIDAKGRWVTPGIIDPHSHIGMQPSPRKGNGVPPQGSAGGAPPVTNDAGLWIEHSVWPQDPMFERAAEAGVTTIQILPGSAKLFNGRTVVLKNVHSTSVQGMKFPGAPYGLKMACGENPDRGSGRAGNMQGYRSAFIAAAAYLRHWDDYHHKIAAGQSAEPPQRDLTMETLAGVLRGQILVQIHCYRANDMMQIIDLSREFGFHITAFHHALEAFKIAPLLAAEKIGVITWAGDWSGYKPRRSIWGRDMTCSSSRMSCW